MLDKKNFIADCESIRNLKPIIHCITNNVAMDFNANALLSIGAKPIMSVCKDEFTDIITKCGALLINIGTIDEPQTEACEFAARIANSINKPWVLDPVGAGFTTFRSNVCKRLIDNYHPSVIKGNISEIRSLSGCPNEIEGAKLIANQSKCVVAMTGPVDYITDGTNSETLRNGSTLMDSVTAMGCTAGAITAAFLAVQPSAFTASADALALMGLAGSEAETFSSAPGSFKTAFIDTLYKGVDVNAIKQ